jgi:parvulin-like peptidyl-prolyl isomerase
MRAFVILALFVLSSLSAGAKVVDYIAAVVNGEPILYSEIVKFAKENGINNLRLARDKLIEKKILLTEAKKEGIEVSDEEIEKALKDLMERMGFKSEEEFKEALSKEGLSLEDVKEKLKEQLMVAKLIARKVKSKVSVSELDVKRYCQTEEEGAEREVYYIFTRSDEKAQKALELLKEGVPFEQVARELSDDKVSAEQGGYIGRVKRGTLVKELDEAVWSIAPGSYKLVKSDKGNFIVYVRSEESPSCDEERAREELFMKKFDEALKRYIDELKRKASVKVYM